MKSKLTSRKFWVCVAALLSSLGVSITGLSTSNNAISCAGIICAVVSAAIYAILEAVLDYEKEMEEE